MTFSEYLSKPPVWHLSIPLLALRLIRHKIRQFKSSSGDKIIYDYDSDALRVWQKNVSFMQDEKFLHAYQQGMDSGHHIARPKGSDVDIHIEWRVHTLIWAAQHALRLDGDFVECGVNTGIFSLAVCDYIDFNSTEKHFWLFDTFNGIPSEQISSEERQLGRVEHSAIAYSDCYEIAHKNFSKYPNAHLVQGKVPDTLNSVPIQRVCYLSIDMNIAEPEIAALRYFWPMLSKGAPVILDDYGWTQYSPQKDVFDSFAAEVGCPILLLPTGQGLIIKA